MPAVTLGQLTTALATVSASNQSTFFLEPGGSLASYLNEVGPRLYNLGPWRDLMVERAYLAADGYIALDHDIEAVHRCNINNGPRRAFSQFHDMEFYGNSDFLPSRYGMVDLGYSPLKREIASVQGVDELDDVTAVSYLYPHKDDQTQALSSALSGTTISVTGYDADGLSVTGTLDTGSTYAKISFSSPVVWIESIVATGVPFRLHLYATADTPASEITEIQKGTDVPRFRRFRIGNPQDDTYVHILGKRAWTTVSDSADIIHLGNIAAWKHGLLGKVAEDNANAELATYHWAQSQKLLDDELANHMGAARPVPRLDLNSGSSGIFSIF